LVVTAYLALDVAIAQDCVHAKSHATLIIQSQEMRWHGFSSLF